MDTDLGDPSGFSTFSGRRKLSPIGAGMAASPRSVLDTTPSIPSQGDSEYPEVTGEKLAGEKMTSLHPQERPCLLKPVAALPEVQPGPKGVRHALLTLEKSEAAKGTRPSSSSPVLCSSAVSAGQATAAALMKEVVGTKATLQKLSESTFSLKAERSKMHRDFAKINTEEERWEMRRAQDGDWLRPTAETQEPPPRAPKTPLFSEEAPLCWKSPKLEEPRVRRASEMAPAAVGEEREEPWLWKQKRRSLEKGEEQPRYPGDLRFSREETDEHLWTIYPLQQERKGDNESADDSASNVSASDILLATIADLTNSTTADATNATAAKLMAILEGHRSSMKGKVSETVVSICGQLSSIPEGQAKRVALNVVASLAEESAWDVVSGLLKHSLPCDSVISEVWRSLCSVLEIRTPVVWNVLKELQERPRFRESHDGLSGDQAGLAPLAAARALGEMLKTFTCTMAMQGFYPQVFLALVTHVHFLVRVPEYMENPRDESNALSTAGHVRFAVETLKTLLTQDGNYLTVLWMDKVGCWDLLSSPEYHLDGVLLLARALVIHDRRHMTGLVAEVIPKLCTEDEERTLTARALFAGFICSKSALKLLPRKNILAKLEGWQADPRPTVRWLSLHGFGNMALHRQKAKRLKALVSRILVGLKEPAERTMKEALRALGGLLSRHQGRVYLGSTCIRIAEQLCPLLTDGRDQVRAAAVGLFGKLLLKLRRRHKSQMRDHILSHVVPFLLHLQESSPDVVECCEWTLARCNDFLGWNLLEEINVLAHYDSQEALSQICKCLVQRYQDQVPTFLMHTLDYMKSPAAPLRRAATVLTGFLVFYLDATVVSQDVTDSLLSGLVDLEHDREPSISSAASVSLLQVKQACGNTARRGLLHTLGQAFCYVSSSEKDRPLFEDSPFKRKRSLEVFDEAYF